uniref:G-protein coupled receptors family 1 profile domain-containing protein n=1 Tax=Leptobrachium leishanense TaxID=445787 RepID=A0A8C5LPD2_9ANUR
KLNCHSSDHFFITMNSSSICFFKESNLSPVLAEVLMVEFILGLIGNGIILYVFCFHIPTWNNSTLYLFNVSVADFCLVVCLPLRAEYYQRGKDWRLGDVTCRIMLFMISLTRTASIFFLTAVVGNRYFLIVHPHHRINMMQIIPCGAVVTLVLWLFTFSCTAHILTTSHLIFGEINQTLCESSNWNWIINATFIWQCGFFVVEFLIPLGVILFCTSCMVKHLKRCKDKQGKIQKTINSVICVATVFLLCFFPSTVSTVLMAVSKTLNLCELFNFSSLVFTISLTLTYLNSVLNPLVIYMSSPVFQSILNIKNVQKCRKATGAERRHSTSSPLPVFTRRCTRSLIGWAGPLLGPHTRGFSQRQSSSHQRHATRQNPAAPSLPSGGI